MVLPPPSDYTNRFGARRKQNRCLKETGPRESKALRSKALAGWGKALGRIKGRERAASVSAGHGPAVPATGGPRWVDAWRLGSSVGERRPHPRGGRHSSVERSGAGDSFSCATRAGGKPPGTTPASRFGSPLARDRATDLDDEAEPLLLTPPGRARRRGLRSRGLALGNSDGDVGRSHETSISF